MFSFNRGLAKFKYSVGRRLIIYILLFSSIVTFLGTSIQLYVEYVSDIKSIQKTFQQIESSYLTSLSASLWAIDRQQTDRLLDGILKLPDIQYIEIRQSRDVFSSAGKPELDNILKTTFNLTHAYKGQGYDLGILVVTASLKGVYTRLLNRIFIIAGTQAVKTFLVSAFIFFIFYYLVGRHLIFMAEYVKNFNLDEKYIPLTLRRGPKMSMDELDQLAHSLNVMNQKQFDHITAITRAEKEAEKSEKRFKKLIEKSPLPMVVTDINQDLLLLNDKFTEMFGYVKDDVPTAAAWWETAYPDMDYRIEVQQAWNDAIESAKNSKTEIEMQTWELTTKNRLKRTCEFHMVPFDDIGLIIVNDITHREIALREKETLQNQLQQAKKMESIGRLAGGVAHDFNNMLSIILGNAEILMEDLKPNHPCRFIVMEIQKAAEQSANLTRQLLAFARKQTVSPQIVNLNTAIEGMLNMLRRLIGEDIDLSWNPKGSLCTVKMDISQIDQMLANLCINARDAIKDVGKIIIETDNAHLDEDYCSVHQGVTPGDYVRIKISDNGCGMDKETIENLFEPFFTTKKTGEGTGLGLATVYGIIKQNNGFINVYSEINQGTAFKIYLPRHESPRMKQMESSKEAPQTGTETILLVEDETQILKMATLMLKRLGYNILAANTPDEAIKISRESKIPIHLLITDVVMPSMNGRELAEKILTESPDIKCLFTSGYTANVIAHKGIIDKGLNFISKPYSKQDISTKIRQILDKD